MARVRLNFSSQEQISDSIAKVLDKSGKELDSDAKVLYLTLALKPDGSDSSREDLVRILGSKHRLVKSISTLKAYGLLRSYPEKAANGMCLGYVYSVAPFHEEGSL